MAAKKCLICSSSFSGRRDAKTCSARCRKRLQLVRFNLHAPTKRQLVSKVLTVAAFGVFGTLALLFANSSPTVQAATSTFFNFQARLLTSTGAVVADGNYNIEFKIYDDIDDGQGSLLWTETRKVDGGPDNRVRVVSGYFSVKLGEVTALPSINWNQELFLTMNIGGTTTGAPSWDGEMLNSSKRIQLTAVPYAFTAKELQMTSGSFTNTLLFATPSGSSKTITIPNETGTVCTTGSVCSGYQAAGSLTLQSAYDAGAAGDQVITLDSTQDSIVIRNPSSSGSDSTYVLTLDQLATGARGGLSIQSAGTGNLLLITDTTATAADVLTIADGGAATFKNQTNSATAFQIQNAASGSLLQVDSTTGGAITLLGNNSGELTSWTSDTDTLPAARGAVATASYNGYVYAIAGFTTGGTAQDDIYYARLNANGGVSAWTTESDLLPANRKHMAAVAANGYLYTFGGQSAGVNTATSNVYYTKLNGDGSTGAWSELTASVLPSARSEIGAFIYNNYVYIIGGSSGDSDQATATTYDTSYYAYLNADGTLGPWNTTTILPAARGMVQPVTANGYVYVIGGTDTDANTVNTSYYAKLNADGTIGAWTADPDTLPTSRGTGGVVINNGYIYYMGGWISGGSSTQSTTYYSPLSSDGSIGAWTTNTAAFAEARDALKGFTANGYLYAIGGTTSGTVKDTIYYASGSRVTIGGGLDLVGLAGENLSEGGSGGTLTAGNTKIVGSLEVQGQTSFSQNVGIGGSLSVGGTVAIQPSLDSTAGFKVADRLGKAIISVNTSTLDNLLLDGNFEGNVSTGGSGWTAVGSATLTSDATQFKIGARSLKAATSVATTPSGMSYNFPFKARTAYTLSFWARADSTLSAANEEFGFLVNGTSNNCTDSGLSTTWVYHTCTFTTGATVLITDSIYMREVDTGAAYSIYLDGVMLEEGSSASSFYVDPGFGLTNLITNPSFENGNHNGWTEKGSSINHGLTGDYVKFGALAHVFTTTAAANDGTQYRFPFRPSTQYSLSLWMRLDTGTTSSINVGRADTAGSDSNCLTGQTVDTTWRQFACTFSTGATIGEASSLYIKQTDAASKNIKVDGVTLVQASSGLSFVADGSAVQADNLNSNLTLNGSNNGEIQAWKQSSNDLPVIKNAGTSAVANGYLYVIGGDNGTVNVDTVYYTKLKADGSISAWQSGTVLPAAIAHPTAAVANGYLYVLGGKTSSTYQNKVYYAKLNTDGSYGAWQTNSNALGTAVYRHTTVVNNGYIYVIGGQISDTPTRTANTYYAKLNADGSTGPFTSTTALPASKGFHTSFVTNGYVFVIGGDGTPDSYSAPLNANGTIGSWTNLSPSAPPTATYANGGVPVFAGGYFYLLGGRDVNNNYRANVIYNKISEDFDINQWQTSQYSLPANRAYYELAQANGYIYVVGGFDGSASHVTTYYASLPRTLLGGGLDLVGLGSQNLAEYGGGGDLTAGNTQIVGSLQVQGQTSFAQSIGVNGNGTFNGDIAVLAQTNNTPHSFGSTCDCLVNTTAGTFGAETLRDAAFSGAVYNGKLYVATKETDASAIYRYDGDKAFTKVTDAAGKIIAGDTANIDASVLTVYNGKLYAGTQTGSASGTAAVYSYDGTTWTLLLATRGTFGAETARDGVSALSVVNGRLYAYTQEPNAASVYRFDGSTSWTRIGGVGQVLAETADIDEGRLIGYGGNLWLGAVTGASTARVYKYDGNTFTLMNTTAGTFASGTTGVDDVTSMAVYADQLFIGTRETNLANIYVFKGGYDGGAGADVFGKTTSTSGRIDSTADATDVDSVPSMQVYNGRLYAGSETAGLAAVYEMTGISTTSSNDWTIVNSARGTFGAQTGLDAVDTLISFNGSLYVGTEDTASNNGAVYTYTKTSGNSYSLQFSSGGSNTGGISFVGSQQVGSNTGNTGSFIFTHGIMSTSGSYDVAEDFPTRDESLKPGDLVSIDSGEIGFVKKTSKANDPSILGIYSEKPGLRLSQADGNLSGGKAIPVALAGRVVVNVTDENGPIMPGDYLTSSNRTGYAMKATKAGPTLGKALEPSSDESGKVLAFVNVSYYIPTTELQGGDAILVDYLLISGLAKIENLEVVGDATFKGNIIVAGHFVTAGESPQTVVLAANTSANDPQIDIEGNDTSGSIKVVTTQSVQPGDLAKVIFAQPFDKRPKVFIYPSNLEATTVQLYREVQVNYFIIKLISPLASDRTYEFNYLIVE